MPLYVKWIGIDFGQCLMDTTRQRTYWMIGDISKELGQPELIDERCHKWRVMKEKYGSWPAIKESYRPEVVSYVFDNHPEAAEIFIRVEQRYMSLADGAVAAIKDFREQGIEISVVAELKRTLGPISKDVVMEFLRYQNIIHYFDELITPQGKVNLRNNEVDLTYVGKSKEEGNIYDILLKDLARKNIKPSEAVMVGDKEWSDIGPAKKRGMNTVLYTGYICRGPTVADYTISHFSELKNLLSHGKV
jgi:FMN phosphatase YigB (HAD superfamily)